MHSATESAGEEVVGTGEVEREAPGTAADRGALRENVKSVQVGPRPLDHYLVREMTAGHVLPERIRN